MNATQRQAKRLALYQRDGPNITCHWCKKPLQMDLYYKGVTNYATLEHLIRRADGGTNQLSNLVFACPKCNNERHNEPSPSKSALRSCLNNTQKQS